MPWTVPAPKADEKGVGNIAVVYNQGQPDEWKFDLGSFDLNSVKDLTPYADKIKAIHAEYVAEQAKANPFADMAAALEAGLNKG